MVTFSGRKLFYLEYVNDVVVLSDDLIEVAYISLPFERLCTLGMQCTLGEKNAVVRLDWLKPNLVLSGEYLGR